MAKKTLLEMVQSILSDTDADNVSSVGDTVESEQAVQVIRDTHDYIVDSMDLGHVKTLDKLEATSASTPNVMTRPEGLYDIEWIRYNKKITAGGDQTFENVRYLPPSDFIDLVSSRTVSDSNVEEVTLSTGAVIPVVNDRAPTYYTIMDQGSDEIVFDSYDSDLETNLQESKSLVYGSLKPTLGSTDSSTMSLPKHLENYVLAEAKAMYFDLYKDGVTREVDRRRRYTATRAQRQRYVLKDVDNKTGPDYGRK